jgi:hypothetical protein
MARRLCNSAAMVGHVEVIKTLAESGANKQAKNVGGESPLHFAAQMGKVEALSVLVSLGVDKEAKDVRGMTALSSLPHTGRPLLGGSCPPSCGEGTLCSLAPSAPPQGLRPRATTLGGERRVFGGDEGARASGRGQGRSGS